MGKRKCSLLCFKLSMGRKSLIGPNTILSINVMDYKRIAAHKYRSQHRLLQDF
jgi:hypothetical protein